MAGGIGEHNIKKVASAGFPWDDSMSKVEDENGIKDAQKIEKILKIIGEVEDEH